MSASNPYGVSVSNILDVVHASPDFITTTTAIPVATTASTTSNIRISTTAATTTRSTTISTADTLYNSKEGEGMDVPGLSSVMVATIAFVCVTSGLVLALKIGQLIHKFQKGGSTHNDVQL